MLAARIRLLSPYRGMTPIEMPLQRYAFVFFGFNMCTTTVKYYVALPQQSIFTFNFKWSTKPLARW